MSLSRTAKLNGMEVERGEMWDKFKVDRWGCAAGSISWFLSRRSQFAVSAASSSLRYFFRRPPAVFVGEVDAPS